MRIKRIELNNIKRFTHLVVEGIPDSAKLIMLVGPNGSGKTSFLESMNHYYLCHGFNDYGDSGYLFKKTTDDIKRDDWYRLSPTSVNIESYDCDFATRDKKKNVKGRFYFRSAYRNEPDFRIDSMHRQEDPTDSVRLSKLIDNDKAVSANYQRLVAETISGVFDRANGPKSVETLRNELTGTIHDAMKRVFDDLEFSSIGDPLYNGSFYFSKGTTSNFHYRNLSAGEKSSFDLILDMVVQAKYYPDAVYCIDEPEAHMHTKLQGKVLRELYTLIPGNSQLWVSTHSIGMLQEAEEIEKEAPGTVVFLDFGGRDFDSDQVMRPSKIGKAALSKFYELAFGDFAKLILPSKVVFCEGNPDGEKRKDFDKTILTTIFENTHPEAIFISGGNCQQIVDIEKTHGAIISSVLSNSEVIKIVDRDDLSDAEIEELEQKGIKVLRKRNLEAYLLDDAVLAKLCDHVGKTDKYRECLKIKKDAIEASVGRGNPEDDLKSARGDIYTGIKKVLGLTQCGNNPDAFIRDTLAPLVTPEVTVYKELEADVFGTPGGTKNG